ncbi:hypothetical protein J437_LFUL009678 [Ladona fulva]|uniref:Zinc finger CCCH domain-containing protein 14 n=1 Tax=Ladona fulva TaxID=123851 RepID=A0A8K0KBG6_LADFU|nr:hypothetical protein J437_LFUL009678 [Ladona fulva]
MEGIGAEVNQKVKSAIKAKLVELGVYVDEELPDYIMVMVANKRTKSEMIEDLQLFLGAFTEKFISWLLQVLQKLHEVTAASIDAKRASSSIPLDKDKDKVVKKKKLPSVEAEPESVKKNRKKKIEITSKDVPTKKVKKSNVVKKKTGKPEVVKVAEKRPVDKTEVPQKEKKDENPKESVPSAVEKSNQPNPQHTSRSNPKPVLMVSDEDDEDFINIRADAETDLVCELQEEVKPPTPPQKPVAQVSSLKINEIAAHRQSDASQESSVRAQKFSRESLVSTHKDTRVYRSESDKYAMPKTHLESVAQISSKPAVLRRTQGIVSVADSYRDSGDHQTKDEGKNVEVHRVQPTSKVTLVSRTSIKSRLGKRPCKEESPPRSERMKSKGVPSVVKKSQGLLTKKNRGEFSKIAVTLPNPRVTSTAQPVRRALQDEGARDHLMYRPGIARDMPDSLQSHSRHSSLISSDDVSSSRNLPSFGGIISSGDHTSGHGLLSMREVPPMGELPSINSMMPMNASLHTLPSINDDVSLRSLPTLHEQAPVHNLPPTQDQSSDLSSPHNLPALELQEPTINVAQPSQGLPQTFQSQSQTAHSHQLIRSQSQVILQQSQTQSQLIQTQPQPDIVASLHEGHVTQPCVRRVSRSSLERMTMTECSESPADGSQVKQAPDLCVEMEYQNGDSSRDIESGSYQDGICVCPDLEEESVDMQAKSVSPTVDSPTQMRACSPQFFVTLSGYDPQLQNGGSRVVRGNLSELPRRFLVPDSEEMEEDEEYMDEGIGNEDIKQETVNINDAEMIDDELDKDMQSVGTIAFRNIGPETLDENGDLSMKAKNIERCRFWPACRSGERCEFHHPTTPCKVFPACKFGDKCLYIHPNCKFDSACTRKDCPFTHAIPRSLVIAPVPAPIRAPPRPAQIQCKFFPKCTNVNCKFFHPKPCRFGKACNKYDCPFMHEREQLPPKEKLKWVCPTKA